MNGPEKQPITPDLPPAMEVPESHGAPAEPDDRPPAEETRREAERIRRNEADEAPPPSEPTD